MAAKRKYRPSQPVTLHRFFPGPGRGAKPKPHTFVSQEVIVIDSDDELDVLPRQEDTARPSNPPLKRRKSEGSSDVDVVGDRIVEPKSSSTDRKNAQAPSNDGSLEINQTVESDISLFGKPSALLLPPCNLEPDETSGLPQTLANAHPSTPHVASSGIDDDDWNMGDDEQLIIDNIPNDDEPVEDAETALTSNAPVIDVDDDLQLTTCPMCETVFGDMSPLVSIYPPAVGHQLHDALVRSGYTRPRQSMPRCSRRTLFRSRAIQRFYEHTFPLSLLIPVCQ